MVAHRPRVCVVGAGPCGLTAVKNLLRAGCRDVACYEESDGIGGNWAFTDDPGRAGVHECSHIISSRRMSAFDDFPMPEDYPDFPSHRQLLAYFTGYAGAFGLEPYIHLGSRVERCVRGADGRWTVRVAVSGRTRVERFDSLLVCSGHHREPFLPRYPGTFTGTVLHSCAYKRPEVFRGRRVLVVGGGNSAADIAVDVARVAARTALSLREGTYFVPKLMYGKPVDVVHAYWRRRLPRPLLRAALRLWLRLTIGRWEEYGLPAPAHAPLDRPPTLNSDLLGALRHGRVVARRGIERYDGTVVHFTDGTRDEFDAVIMGTGFRTSFPFLPAPIAGRDRPWLRMLHPADPDLYFIGLFQPIGCIWRLADHQARIAALQITGRRRRPTDRDGEGRRPSGIEVDYHAFRRELLAELS